MELLNYQDNIPIELKGNFNSDYQKMKRIISNQNEQSPEYYQQNQHQVDNIISSSNENHETLINSPFNINLQTYSYNQPTMIENDYLKNKSQSMPTIEYNNLLPQHQDAKYRLFSQPIIHPNDNLIHQQFYNSHNNFQQYPDMTTMVNSNSSMVVPMVESTFVDHRFCNVCGKRITRDMSRHMRTHQSISRFTCKFPKNQCRHKSGRFNRPYDYKKHLLNRHFKFDVGEIKKLHNLSDKLDHWGTCVCGVRFIGKDWLNDHILTDDVNKKCPFIE